MSATAKKRWPQFCGWDEKATAIETLAKTCGAHAYCSQKYKYLNVELHKKKSSGADFLALQQMAEMIEQTTDQD